MYLKSQRHCSQKSVDNISMMNKLNNLKFIQVIDNEEETADRNRLAACRLVCDISHDIQIESRLSPESVDIFDEDAKRCSANSPVELRDYFVDPKVEFYRATPFESMQIGDLAVSNPSQQQGTDSLGDLLEPSRKRTELAGVLGFSSSLVLHCLLLLALTFGLSDKVGGKGVDNGSVISVRLMTAENLIPQDASPSSIDSSPSAPSIAGKEKPEEKTKAPAQQESILEESEKADRQQPPVVKEKMEEEQKPEDEVSKETQKQLVEQGSGKGPVNSAASAPSVASVERSFIPAAGAGEEVFNSKVLSAIKSAIFFPKKAVQEKHHGEVVVKFTVWKDGRLDDVTIIKSSGSQHLDEAVVKILEKASRNFPEFPVHTAREKLEFVAPILFKK